MNVIFEGAISRGWSMPDVLRAVMGAEQDFGVLRINAHNGIEGRIAISERRFIVGALLSDGSAQGYAALRRLLMTNQGNFAYLDTNGKIPAEFDESLYLSLDKVIASLPNLPEDFDALFDEKSLLDKLFGGEQDVLEPTPPRPMQAFTPSEQQQQFVNKARQVVTSAAERSANEQRESGRRAGPLLGDSVTVSGRRKNSFEQADQEISAHKLELGRLRSQEPQAEPWYKAMLSDSVMSKRTMTLLIVGIFLLSLIATLLVSAFVNRPN